MLIVYRLKIMIHLLKQRNNQLQMVLVFCLPHLQLIQGKVHAQHVQSTIAPCVIDTIYLLRACEIMLAT